MPSASQHLPAPLPAQSKGKTAGGRGLKRWWAQPEPGERDGAVFL